MIPKSQEEQTDLDATRCLFPWQNLSYQPKLICSSDLGLQKYPSQVLIPARGGG